MRLKCDLGLISVAFKSISFYSNYNGLVLNAGLKAGIYSVAIFHSNIVSVNSGNAVDKREQPPRKMAVPFFM